MKEGQIWGVVSSDVGSREKFVGGVGLKMVKNKSWDRRS